MNTCSQTSNSAYPWQATFASVLMHLKDELELANSTIGRNHTTAPKKLTTEAIFMIFVILFFLILTLIRSLISVFESCKVCGKETHKSKTEKKMKAKDGVPNTEKEKKLYGTTSYAVFLTNLKKFLDCFCIKSNAKKLLNTETTQEHLSCLHGIRSIVVIWTLVGHISMFYGSSAKPSEIFKSFLELKVTQILKNAAVVIDAFLVLGGFLTGYLFTQHYKEKKGNISWFSFYVYRFIRIAPMYFIVLGFYAALFPHLGSGPIWPTYTTNPVCKDTWIWNVLFLNNFISYNKMCYAVSWYVACEMQIHIISPLFILLLIRRPKVGYVLAFLGIFGSCFINFLFTLQYKLSDGPSRLAEYYSIGLKEFLYRNWEHFDILYSKPYARIGSFLIGMALGYYLSQKKGTTTQKCNQVQLSLGWIMTVIFFYFPIFALYGRKESVFENAVYNGLKDVMFSIGIAWIIFVCVTGQGGFVNRFLSSKIFRVTSRLSYMIYLTHMLLLKGYFLSREDLIDHTALKMVIYHSNAITIILVTFFISLIFEAPMLRITTLFFSKDRKKTKSGKQE